MENQEGFQFQITPTRVCEPGERFVKPKSTLKQKRDPSGEGRLWAELISAPCPTDQEGPQQSVPHSVLPQQTCCCCCLSCQIILQAGSQDTAAWTEAASKNSWPQPPRPFPTPRVPDTRQATTGQSSGFQHRTNSCPRTRQEESRETEST